MKKPLTKMQKKVLKFIVGFIKKNDYSPTLEEIGDGLSITKATVWVHIQALKKNGNLVNEVTKYVHRSFKPKKV